MNQQLLADGLVLFLQLAAPLLGAVLAGAVAAGLVRAVTRIDDRALAFAGKIGALGLLLYVLAGSLGGRVLEFARVVWGSSQNYF